MTEEKRKRCRPPGTGKKIKNAEDAYKAMEEFSSPEEITKIRKKVNDIVSLGLPEGVTELECGENRKAGLAIDTEKFKRPFPDNFFSLNKVDKLQWLTANKK